MDIIKTPEFNALQREYCIDTVNKQPWGDIVNAGLPKLDRLTEFSGPILMHVYGAAKTESDTPDSIFGLDKFGILNIMATAKAASLINNQNPTIVIAGDHGDEWGGIRICEIYMDVLSRHLAFAYPNINAQIVLENDYAEPGAHDTVGEMSFLQQLYPNEEALSISVGPHTGYIRRIAEIMGQKQLTAIPAEAILIAHDPESYYDYLLIYKDPYLSEATSLYEGMQQRLKFLRKVYAVSGNKGCKALLNIVRDASTALPELKRKLNNKQAGSKRKNKRSL